MWRSTGHHMLLFLSNAMLALAEDWGETKTNAAQQMLFCVVIDEESSLRMAVVLWSHKLKIEPAGDHWPSFTWFQVSWGTFRLFPVPYPQAQKRISSHRDDRWRTSFNALVKAQIMMHFSPICLLLNACTVAKYWWIICNPTSTGTSSLLILPLKMHSGSSKEEFSCHIKRGYVPFNNAIWHSFQHSIWVGGNPPPPPPPPPPFYYFLG